MARFSQQFLQGLLQPTYQQGLFEAARNIGQTPGIMRLQRQEEEKRQGILTGTMALQKAAVAGEADEQAISDYAKQMEAFGVPIQDIIRTTNSIRETSKDAAKTNAAAQINAIAATMDPTTLSESELKIKNDKMIEIASQNNIDITPYVGLYMDLTVNKLRYESQVEEANFEQIKQNYMAMTPSAREAYKKTPEGKQYSLQLMEVDSVLADAERTEIMLNEARDTGGYREYAPKLFKSISDRINKLEDGPVKTSLVEQFETFKKANPDFSVGGTLTSVTAAKRIVDSLEKFNNSITSEIAAVRTASQRAERERDDERNAVIKTTLSVSKAEVDSFIDSGAAERALEESNAPKNRTNIFGRTFYSDYSDEQIAQKARELAVQSRRDIAESSFPELFDQFVVGQTYTDSEGNKAVYKGNGQWEEVEQGES